MKPYLSKQTNHALTRVDVLVLIIVAILLIFLSCLAITATRRYAQRFACLSNLKDIGIASRVWASDHKNKYPMSVSIKDGGGMELVATGGVAGCFQVMSNELGTPKILFCPAEFNGYYVTDYFDNSHISYFLGLDADENKSEELLCGDDSFAIANAPVQSGVVELSSNTPVSWTASRHKYYGNIGFSCGIEEVTCFSLTKVISETGLATNRLAIP